MPARAKRSFVDRALSRVGLTRSSKVGSKRSVYAGAAINRLNQDWIMANLSADQSIRGDFRALRERSRSLVRDNAYARRFIQMWAENVIGPDGIKLQARVKLPSEDLDTVINKKIENAWADFSKPENASVDGLLSLRDIATLAAKMWKQDGEALIRMWPGFGNAHAFSLQIIDADMLDHELNRAPGGGYNEIRMGVERNQWGKAVAYWLWTSHPSDSFITAPRQRIRVPAEEIIHLYEVDRPGQTRGVTAFTAVMSDLNMLNGYQEAELVAARMAACQMGFIQPGTEGDGPDPDADPSIPQEAEPGIWTRLGPGETVAQFDPQHPVSAFGQFVNSILRSISSGLGVSYSALTGDLSQANYGSLRDGSLKERDGYKRAQNWFAQQFYRRVYLQWMKYAVVSGALQIPAVNLARYQDHAWLPRGWAWIDPEKDINASIKAVAAGFDTRSRICAENGRDFQENIETLSSENDLAAEWEVTLSVDPGKAEPVVPDDTKKPAGDSQDETQTDLKVA